MKFIWKSILNIIFWIIFLNLMRFHVHNSSWITTYTLTLLVAINIVFNSWEGKK